MSGRPRVILWTGPRHSGKTTAARHLVERLRAEGFAVAGLLAPAVYQGGVLAGFDVLDLSTGRRSALLRRAPPGAATDVGAFALDERGLRLGEAALGRDWAGKARMVVVDEFGPLELRGGGWRPAVDAMVGSAAAVLLVVRDGLVGEVGRLYAAMEPRAIQARDPQAAETIVAMLADPAG